MDENMRWLVAILAISMTVAIGARRLRLPYTVGLVLFGISLALTKIDLGLHLTHDLIFDLILPPLLFEAAISLPWRELVVDALPLLTLAGVGTIVAAGVVAVAMATFLGWPLSSAFVFGALIAATDPVAIIAMFKDNKLKGRLRLLVESESLFNDGVAAVLFVVALTLVDGGNIDQGLGGTILSFTRIVCGGIVIGLMCGGLMIAVSFRTEEHLIEAALTTIVAYGAFLVAEYFHVSGVLATVSAGLLIGNMGLLQEKDKSFLSSKGREFVHGFWEFAAFLANSVVFLLIGFDVASISFADYGLFFVIETILIVLMARAVTVYPLSAIFLMTSCKITLREQHVLWWGGLRGALALALALSLPESLPHRDDIVVATFGVVAFSILVQGLTMPILLRTLGYVSKN